MPGLDIFRSDAFSLASLTDAILKAPFVPGRLGNLGVFREGGISTTAIILEEKDGVIELIQTGQRGAPATTLGGQKRTARSFVAHHLAKESTIYADEVQNVRAFGSEDAAVAVQAIVNERLAILRAMHEVTLEHLRISALQGIVLDADGTTLFNLFTEFGVTQQTEEFDFGTSPVPGVRAAAVATRRKIEDALGATPVTSIRALCGSTFFDALVDSPGLVETVKYQASELLRGDLRAGFSYGGIIWEEYRGSVSGQDFVGASLAYAYPENTDIFRTYFAPGDFMETVNTLGLPVYAKVAIDAEFQRWAKLHTQSNPLALCKRPDAVIKLTIAA